MAEQNTAHWLEVTIYVDGEAAEAVAELFARYSDNGVVCEQGVEYDESEEHAFPVGPVKVSGYIEVNDELDTVRQKIDEGLYYIGRIVELPPAQFRWVEDKNWMDVFRNYYRPIEVGENLLILPAWAEYDGDRMPIRIDPSMAFGTGTHPTTQLSMAMLEKHITPDVKLIDIGCGSGGLIRHISEANSDVKLYGIDISEISVKAAQKKCRSCWKVKKE